MFRRPPKPTLTDQSFPYTPLFRACGLGLMKPEAAADEAEAVLEGGFRAVKLRLGYPTIDEDLAVTRAVRRRLPDEIALMVDYNQALTVNQALDRGRALDREGIAWIEEPIRHDDWAGNRALVRALRDRKSTRLNSSH